MSTSGTYSFSVTRDQIIRMAMITLGKLYETEIPSPQEVTDLTLFLNAMVKQWQAKADFAPGLKVWTRKRGELYLSSTTGQFSLGSTANGWGSTHNQNVTSSTKAAGQTVLALTTPTGITNGDVIGVCQDNNTILWTTGTLSGSNLTLGSALTYQTSVGAYVFNYTAAQIRPERIETAVLRDVNYNDIPLSIMNLQDYEYLPTKASNLYLGDPQALYYEYRLDNSGMGIAYLDVGASSDVTKHIHIVFLAPVQDITNATDNPEFPQGWYMALAMGLAKLAAPIFNKQWTETMEDNRVEALAMAREQFPDTSTMFFEPGRDDMPMRTV